MYIYKICIGDSSGDGHGMKKWLLLECSLDKHKLLEAYDKLTEQLGFDFVKTVCHDFENHYISKDQLEAINRVLGKTYLKMPIIIGKSMWMRIIMWKHQKNY